MANFIKSSIESVRNHKKPIIITTGIILFLILSGAASYFAYAKAYEGRVLPNVYIGVVDVGELTQADATEVLQQHIDDLLGQGVDVSVNGHSGHLDLRASIIDEPDLAHDIIYYNTAEQIEAAMEVGRTDNIWLNLITPIAMLFQEKVILQSPQIDTDDLRSQIEEQFGDLEEESKPADYEVNLINEEEPVRFKPGVNGTELDITPALSALREQSMYLELSTVEIEMIEVVYEMTEEDALSLSDEVIEAIEAAPYYLTYTSDTLREYWWTADADDIANWLEPRYITEDGERIPALTFAGDSFDAFKESIANDVNIDPVDAVFTMEGGVVTEFQGHQEGVSFDEKVSMGELLEALGEEDTVLTITTFNSEPDILTSDVNDYGISEVIGVGTSDFSGSPSNRISNIQHGASKLDGLLIAPGETVSLIDQLGPFTIADGYLAELVIKGDEIKPEVGGGLCQIGTTTFRAVMNSGLQVDERRNHSLVVSYYNDPSNGNPGTDATIYDPYPDFKFTNNYENYILLQAEVDVPNRDVIFTFWGTDDGREGYYTAPVILSWTGYGETQYTETLDLAPGEQSCQSPHPGATAEFTYYVDYADGEQFSETYTSVYRSLPMICLVGVEELTEECEGEECEAADESAETDASDDIGESDATEDDIEIIEEDLTSETE